MRLLFCPYCMSPIQPNTPCPKCGCMPDRYAPASHHLPPGTMLVDRYLLGRVLGEGGFGITYIGWDTRLDRRVAIKEYFPTTEVSRDCSVSQMVHRYTGARSGSYEAGRDRFLREARALARMDKTREIVAVRDFFEANDTAYIVMEYVDGTTFKDLVAKNNTPIPADRFLDLIRPLFHALEALHSQGLIHRDISPDNLMLENGRVRLLDFGCARESLDGSQTVTIVLKQGFSPVEQYQYKGQGPWTDVYSLAATIYFCITGRIPVQPLERLTGEELIPPRQLGAKITEQQEQALLFAMGLQPTRRFRSIQAFYASLYENAPIPAVCAHTRKGRSLPILEEQSDLQDTAAVPPAEEFSHTEQPPAGSIQMTQPGSTSSPNTYKPVRSASRIRKRLLGAGAAAVLAVGIWFAAASKTPAPPTAQSAPPGPSQPVETYGVSKSPGLLSAAVSATAVPQAQPDCTVQDTASFLLALEDDAVQSITVAPYTNLWLSDTLEIKKPVSLGKGSILTANASCSLQSDLTVQSGAKIQCNGDLTVSGALTIDPDSAVELMGQSLSIPEGGTVSLLENGSLSGQKCCTITVDGGKLTLDGTFSCRGLVHTCSGGSIEITEHGTADVGLLWLQKPRDIVGAERLNLLLSDLILLDDTISDSAVAVRNQQELESAMSNPLVLAARLAEDISLDRDLTISKLLLIPADCTLSVSSGFDVRLMVSDLLISEGTLQGCTVDLSSGNMVNRGTAAVSLCSTGDGNLVNQGTLILADQNSHFERSKLLNMGTIQVGTPGMESIDAAFRDGRLWNLQNGSITLTSGNTMLLSLGLGYYSTGTLTVEAGAALINNAFLDGNLVLAGALRNSGGVLRLDNLDLRGGELTGGLVLADSDHAHLYDGLGTAVLVHGQTGSGIAVSDAEAFLLAAEQGLEGIQVSGDIVIDQPVDLVQNLAIPEGASLTIHGSLTIQNGAALDVPGLLTVDNLQIQDGYLRTGPTAATQTGQRGIRIANGGSITLIRTSGEVYGSIQAEQPGSVLRIEDGSLLYNQNCIEGFSISVSNSQLCNTVSLAIPDGGSLTLENSNLDLVSNLHMQNGTFSIDSGSQLNASAFLDLDNCTFQNDGTVYLRDGEFAAGADGMILNSGYMEVGAFWNGNVFLVDGNLENRGTMKVRCDATIQHIDNVGELVLQAGYTLTVSDAVQNSGTFALEHGFYRGTVKGNPVVDRG